MVPDLDKYISLNPGSKRYLADGYLNRGIAHAVTGNTAQAEKDLTTAIELAPTYADPYGARAMLYREMKKEAQAAADQKQFEELKGKPKE
jgi:Tfp pilus assembly protein PilF